MKRQQLKKIILLLAVVSVVGGIPTYSKASTIDGADASVFSEKSSDSTNENGYKLNKYEGVNAKRWVDSNRVLTLKSAGIDNSNSKNYISVYNLSTKEEKNYENINAGELYEVSPNGRYVLFSEPRNIPKVGSEEWEKAVESGELYYTKKDVLDLETGQVVTDIDKTPHNYESEYKWINDEYIFVNHYLSWKIINKSGDVIKEGKYNDKGDLDQWVKLVDVSELKVDSDKISGSFYYTKDFIGADRNLGAELFSRDVNDVEGKSIKKCEHTMDTFKAVNTIVADYFNNNGSAVGGYFANRTFGFNAFDKSGKLIRDYELPFGRNYENLSLSTDGERCAFVEVDSCMNPNRNLENSVLKVLNIKTGEVKEIAKMVELKNLVWSKDGKTLMFNYSHPSQETGQNCKDTYTVTFNN